MEFLVDRGDIYTSALRDKANRFFPGMAILVVKLSLEI
jgi:hypothetical protein